MQIETRKTQDYFCLPFDEHSLLAQFYTFEKFSTDCGAAFHSALLSVTEVDQENLWHAFEILVKEGYEREKLITAIICSKILSEDDMIVMLKIQKFRFEDCWTALRYYRRPVFFTRLKNAIKRSMYTRDYYKIVLNGTNSIPIHTIIGDMSISGKEHGEEDIIFH